MINGPVVGVLATSFGGPYYGGLLDGIRGAVASVGGRIIAVQTLDAGTFELDFSDAVTYRHRVAWEHIDGFVTLLNGANPQYLREAQASGRPVVAISHQFDGVICPAVVADNRSGFTESVRHLIGHGHERIAFAGCLDQIDVRQRYAAYQDALAEIGGRPMLFETGNMQETGGERAARAMLAAGLPSTAVVTANDQNAFGLIRTLVEAGCELPADQAVIGFDDQIGCASRIPSLTTNRQPLDQIGGRAAGLLLQKLNGEPVPDGWLLIPTTLVLRESCGCPGPLALASGSLDTLGESGRLLAELRAALPPGSGTAQFEQAVSRLSAVVADAVAGSRTPVGTELRRLLLPIAERLDDFEVTVAVMRLIRDHAWAMLAAGGSGREAQFRVEALIHQVFVVLAQAQSAFQAEHGRSTMSALGTQYSVSMQLLRSQERDPRSLDWLRATDIRSGCLGLWPNGPERRTDVLDVVTTYDRAAGAAVAGGGLVEIESFPPAEVIELADTSADEMVYVAHLKVGEGDWGMLALVGPVQAGLAEGRETMNQWAALLSVALEHDAVLQALRAQEEVLRRAALYDDLTGLPNRSHFRDRLTLAMARGRRRPDLGYAVLLLDLDGFKVVNDSLGHEAGDRLLQEIARRLSHEVRTNEVAARLGGDEFAVLVEDFTNPEAPVILAERLQGAVSAPYRLDSTDVTVTASIGIALGTDEYTDTYAVMRDADTAMYHAKTGGKRAYALFTPSMHTSALERLRTGTELRQAVERNELELFYQPIIDLATDRLTGAEALLRWRHPTRGLLLPPVFLPIADESDLSAVIGRWVLREACRQAAIWSRDPDLPRLRVSVNVSNRQFWGGRLIEDVLDCLDAEQLDPACLALEITEGVIMHDARKATEMLTGLCKMDIEVHIDDFGTGYSSLESLHDLPFDALKIDRSFVSRLSTSSRSRELVRTIVTMGLNLGLRVIAEGVETTEDLDLVRQLGCTHAQGYLFSRPAPAGDLNMSAAREPWGPRTV
ncbi:EAL domain-containing protein [Pseudosporangium ferrugineum]|uniref:Diguanylate cyclase (GGDEF)-like protein n=1 Tax=Pseudosporangium ferrugineum TaxID=439699 RepID=A0A2T0RER4_9ACTN|nr:EAL domain-containing protein [Pseudosporangium ferrugineum]PRY19653.1 diguanylate cyclase (GGDEF)-like protein [Pseudosporangium ferrugineum]